MIPSRHLLARFVTFLLVGITVVSCQSKRVEENGECTVVNNYNYYVPTSEDNDVISSSSKSTRGSVGKQGPKGDKVTLIFCFTFYFF